MPGAVWAAMGRPISLLDSRGIWIRSIWVADTLHNGTSSSVLNSDLIHDPVSSWSHSRDLMHMINTFRSETLQPIVGIGHSLGASQLAMLSLYNPALFTTLILLGSSCCRKVVPVRSRSHRYIWSFGSHQARLRALSGNGMLRPTPSRWNGNDILRSGIRRRYAKLPLIFW